MKRKILLAILTTIFTLLISIGGAVWLIPDFAIFVDQLVGVPVAKTPVEISNISVAPFYYGEETLTISGRAIAKNDSLTDISSDGTWTILNTKIQVSATTSTLSATATVTFIPYDKQYRASSKDGVPVSLPAVAKYNGKYYSSIDGALTAANSSNSGTVYSLPLGYTLDTGRAKNAKTIETTTEIKSGVTLTIPYANDASGNPLDTSVSYVLTTKTEYKTVSFGNTNYLANQIYVAKDLEITNAGRINIAGQVSGGAADSYLEKDANGNYLDNVCSMTTGLHGQINLNDRAKIISTGTIDCYGFINETTKNNQSEVIMERGTSTVVFSIVENRGGAACFGLINPEDETVKNKLESAAVAGVTSPPGVYDYDSLQVSPFNRFYIASITAKTTVKYEAILSGHVDLYANNDDNLTTIKLVSQSNSLIILQKSTAYVVCKYDYSTHVMDLDVYGDMKLSPMHLSLTVTKSASFITSTVQVTLGTTSVFFPISDYLDVNLYPVAGSSTVDFSEQKIKLLPGSKLTVHEKVTLNAKSIAVYENNNLFSGGYDKHYETNVPAELFVNGSLFVESLGGTIQTNNAGAVLNITLENTTLSKEILSTEPGKTIQLYSAINMPYTKINYCAESDCTFTANGNIEGNSSNFTTNRIYASQGNYWKDVSESYNSYEINYDFNDGISSTISQSYYIEGESTTIYELPITPTRPYYIFSGWYLEDGSALSDGITIEKDTTLTVHAEWSAITYTIVTYVKDETDIFYQYDISYSFEYDTMSDIVVDKPNVVTVGWYLDQALSEKLEGNIFKKATFDQLYANKKIIDNTIYLYGASLPMYDVIFETGGKKTIAPISLLHGSELDLSDSKFTFEIDSDPNEKQYFVHWEDANGNQYSSSDSIILTSNMTLTAKFENKTTVSFVQIEANGNETALMSLYYKPNTYISNLDQICTKEPALSPVWALSSDENKDSATETPYIKNAGWTLGTDSGINSYTVGSENVTFKATFSLSTNTADVLTYYKLTITLDKAKVSIETSYGRNEKGEKATGGEYKANSSIYIESNKPFYVKSFDYNGGDKNLKCTLGGTQITASETNAQKITSATTLNVTSESCVAAGTLITLADGTQKKVEDIVETDILLVFDHETGKYVESAITFIERDGWDYYNVINLEFSNGTKTRLIYEHGLFDLTLNKYVYIDESNYQSFVGHKFAMMGENGNAYETVTLEKAYITNEYTGCFSLVTVYHLNYFIDGLFSMPGGISGLFNYFEYGEGLKYDEEKMQADIEKYGLFTYEDFEGYIPYEIYEYVFPAKYYKVSIGKGLMTWEDILEMIERYLVKNGVM